jgi:hypothetical protein
MEVAIVDAMRASTAEIKAELKTLSHNLLSPNISTQQTVLQDW